MTTGKQPLSETGEMHFLDNKSGILRINHSGKPHLNGPCETEQNQGLAGANNSETSTILPRIWKLLLTIYTWLWKFHPTSQQFIEKG